MKRGLSRTFFVTLAVILLFAMAVPVFGGTQATIKHITGRVEIKLESGRWVPARLGMILDTGALISTGIGASAVLEVGSSILDIKPLTRMAIDELVTEGGIQTTTLSLRVGKVRADVKTTSSVSHDFRIRSPISTAAVRGTVFSFSGGILETEAGKVNLINAYGQNVNVGPNERAVLRKNYRPEWALAAQESHGQVEAPAPGTRGNSVAGQANRGRGKGRGWTDETPGLGSVTIEWRY